MFVLTTVETFFKALAWDFLLCIGRDLLKRTVSTCFSGCGLTHRHTRASHTGKWHVHRTLYPKIKPFHWKKTYSLHKLRSIYLVKNHPCHSPCLEQLTLGPTTLCIQCHRGTSTLLDFSVILLLFSLRRWPDRAWTTQNTFWERRIDTEKSREARESIWS